MLRVPRAALVSAGVGLVALVLAGVLGAANPARFFPAYLAGYVLWLGLGLGCTGVLMVQFLTGGAWGLATRRILEAGAGTLPLLAVLFVPLLAGLPQLYSWARPDEVAADPTLQHRAVYLNLPFFLVRTIVYLASWVVVSYLLRRWSLAQDRAPEPVLVLRRLQRLSIIGGLVLGLTVSFAVIDWLMSIEVDWFSTVYPGAVALGMLLGALAFAILVLVLLARSGPLDEMLTPRVANDLGSLLLAFLMLWAYVSFFQYLLVWAGNLSDEIPWYLRRTSGGWLPVAVTIAVVGFLLPFWLLLFRPLKRSRRWLAWVAGLILAMRVIEVYWLVAPPFVGPSGPAVGLVEVLAVVGLGGLWLALFGWLLGRRPLVAVNDARLVAFSEAARAQA
jgi:hypothetical protein